MRLFSSGLKVVADMRCVREYFYAWVETLSEAIAKKVNKLSIWMIL